VNDPYLLGNGTLRNKLGISNAAELKSTETFRTNMRQAFLSDEGPSTQFGLDELQRIHQFLFQDVYEWAGEIRTVTLQKKSFEDDRAPQTTFVPPQLIRKVADVLFSDVQSLADTTDISKHDLLDALSGIFNRLNLLHPFREGNGRTQRIFVTNLARHHGLDLAWDVVTGERMVAVSIAGSSGDITAVRRLFSEITDVARVEALRKAMLFLKDAYGAKYNDIYLATTVAGQTYRGIFVGRGGNDFMMRVREESEWVAIGAVSDVPDDTISGDEVEINPKMWP
jgi:cell filamentation protein